jgi:hypothetical protein
MKLTVDCAFNLSDLIANAQSPVFNDLAFLISRATKIQYLQIPLNTLVSQTFNLQPTPDYPMAAISAFSDGLEVGSDAWFYADPVHFVLQRDTFSLYEQAPLKLTAEDATTILNTLNQHFFEDGFSFYQGNSGQWYLKISAANQRFLPIKTFLLSAAINQDVQRLFPTGETQLQWRKVLNEGQMLLHDHPVNLAREKSGEVAVSSVWISAGGPLPTLVKDSVLEDVLLSNLPFYHGVASLAQKISLPFQEVESVLHQKNNLSVRLSLDAESVIKPPQGYDSWWNFFLKELKARAIRQLVLNIGLHNTTMIVEISPLGLYKFWRKPKPLVELFMERKV